MAVINTNIMSLNAQRNLSATQSALATSVQRLSTGLRVNSAKDDAAGLAIAERMNTQVRGMNVAIRNANDAISLAQTAEGALSKINDMGQRMRELAVQSANATNNESDRASLNQEYQALAEEIKRTLSSTAFNGGHVLQRDQAVCRPRHHDLPGWCQQRRHRPDRSGHHQPDHGNFDDRHPGRWWWWRRCR